MTLTIGAVKSAEPRNRDYKLFDSRGLHLLVSRAGGKSWRLKYRFARKEKLLTIGRFPTVGLVLARELAEEARKLLRSGKDPCAEALRGKAALITASEAVFSRLAEAWLADQTPTWSPANAKRVRYRLERDIYPIFGNIPIATVDASMVLGALRRIEGRGSIETAKRVRSYVRAVFKKAKGERLVTTAALTELDELCDALKPTKRGPKQPALTSFSELLDLQQTVDSSTSSLIPKLASRLLALTVVRVGVLRQVPWSEFYGIDWNDPDASCVSALWKIPAARMKLDVEDKADPCFAHDVPLSRQAVEILRVLRIITGHADYAFPGSRGWRKPMSDGALAKMYKTMDEGRFRRRMVPHGWRSAFSTLMNERAAELERDGDRMLIDIALAHIPPGVSASEWAYNRARYLRPRRHLLQSWADLVSEGLPAPLTLLDQELR